MDRTGLTEDGTLGVRAACAFTGLSRSKLYGLMEQGRLPYAKCDRRRLIPKRALVAFLAAHLQGGWATEDGGGDADDGHAKRSRCWQPPPAKEQEAGGRNRGVGAPVGGQS